LTLTSGTRAHVNQHLHSSGAGRPLGRDAAALSSRLPVIDICLVPLGRDDGDEGFAFEPVDGRENPEQGPLRRETERGRHGHVDRLMEGLSANVRGNAGQYDRMAAILWYCYLSPKRHTQLAVAASSSA